MADEEKTPVEATAQDNAPKAEDPKVYNGKYNSVEELEKAHQELETKLGQQGDDLKNLRNFQAEVYPIIDVVYGNDEIMQQVRQAADAKYKSPALEEEKGNGKVVSTPPDPRVQQQEQFLRQQAIDTFKSKNGLDNLSPDDYARVEEQLTKIMSRWILPGQTVPIDRVSPLLDDAYTVIKSEKLVEDRVLESLATQQTNQRATMSTFNSSSPTDSGAELTPREMEFARKLGVKPEDAALYKKRFSEGNDESIIKN